MTKIQTKTTSFFIAIALITAGLLTSLLLWKSTQILKNEAIEKMLYQTQNQANNFEKELTQLKYITQSTEALLNAIYPKEGITPDNIEQIKEELSKHMVLLGNKMNALSTWIVFNPDIIPKHQNLAFYDKDRDGLFEKADPYNIDSINPNSETIKWWTEAIKKGEIWTEPYYWKLWDMELITYSKAVYINNIFIGCIGSDIDFTQKMNDWNNTKLYSSGYYVLINEDQQFILHPEFAHQDMDEALPPSLSDYIKTNLKNADSGFINYEFSGIKKEMAFKNLSNHWALLSIVPVKEIYKPIYQFGHYILITLLLVIVISILVAVIFSRTITSPIERLGVLFNEARNGNLTVRSNIKTNDELEGLGNQFNFFLNQMQTMITQLKEKECSLIDAKEKAVESDKLKTAFLENLSHEIRTPLTGIVGYAELLITEGFTINEKNEFLETIQKNNDNLLQFVEDIITFSKLERGIIHSHKNEFKLHKLINDIHLELTPLFRDQNVQINFSTKIKIENPDIYIATDYTLLIKLLKILLENAFKFTSKGSVELKSYSSENKWGFYINDTGMGIPAEQHNLIFKKFYKYTDDKTKIYRGVGMGLAIAEEIIKILDGSISLISEQGKGSTFKIEFNLD